MPNFISEDDIEQAILKKLNQQYGYELLSCYTADAADLNDGSNRADKRDVIFEDRLRQAALRLNPTIPENAIDEALERLMDKRHAMSSVAANCEIDGLIRDGIPVVFEGARGRARHERVRVIDFNDAGQNRYLAVSQLWIKGERRYRRPDIILYINGIPLVFIELKNSNIKLKTAFDDNLTNYKQDIPQLFLTNAFCILSNGIETRVGSFTAGWEFFFNWLRATDEKERVDRRQIQRFGTSLEIAVAGLCARDRHPNGLSGSGQQEPSSSPGSLCRPDHRPCNSHHRGPQPSLPATSPLAKTISPSRVNWNLPVKLSESDSSITSFSAIRGITVLRRITSWSDHTRIVLITLVGQINLLKNNEIQS